MSLVTLRATTEAGKRLLRRVLSRLRPQSLEAVVRRTAAWTNRQLVIRTPKGWTGVTRKAWRMIRIGDGAFRVTNDSKVMLFLEEGTRAHGPVSSASVRPWAKDPGNVKHGHERVLAGKSFRAKKLFIPLTRKAAIGGWSPSLRYGKDYVLKDRVKGIRAMHIVRDQRELTAEHLKLNFAAHITQALQ